MSVSQKEAGTWGEKKKEAQKELCRGLEKEKGKLAATGKKISEDFVTKDKQVRDAMGDKRARGRRAKVLHHEMQGPGKRGT